MDARETLIHRLDNAATRDLAETVAIARLNWILIDDEVLRFSQSRVGMTKMQAQAARDQAQIDRNVELQMGALGLGGGGSRGGGYGGFVDPRGPVYEAVHGALTIAVMAHGGVPAGTPPAIVARASDILRGRISLNQAVALLVSSAPPAQQAEAQMLMQVASLPGAEMLIVPILRATAAGAASLADLARIFPNAAIAQPAAPPLTVPPLTVPPLQRSSAVVASTAAGAPPSDASLVDVLLYNAQSAKDPVTADALMREALVAASKTPTISDDILVLQRLILMLERVELAAETVRVAVKVIGDLVGKDERRDDVASVVAWVSGAVVSRGLLDEFGSRVVAHGRTVLNGSLAGLSRAQLGSAVADLLLRLGRTDDATDVLRTAERELSEPLHLLELVLVRADIRYASQDRDGAAETLTAFLLEHTALPVPARRRALEKLLLVWPAGRLVRGWVDEMLGINAGAGEPERTGGLIMCVGALVRTGCASDRARAIDLSRGVDLPAARESLHPSMREMFDGATADFALLVEQLCAST